MSDERAESERYTLLLWLESPESEVAELAEQERAFHWRLEFQAEADALTCVTQRLLVVHPVPAELVDRSGDGFSDCHGNRDG